MRISARSIVGTSLALVTLWGLTARKRIPGSDRKHKHTRPDSADLANRSLAGARARVKRAREHLTALQEREAEFLAHRPARNMFVAVTPGTAAGIVTDVSHQETVLAGENFEAPESASILIGEAVQNLRTALDYLVHGLAWTSGSPFNENDTQFPIALNGKDWRSERKRRLSMLSDKQRDIIGRCQPYRNAANRWLARLAELSNIDKHRLLVVSTAVTAQPMTLRGLSLNIATGRRKVDIEALGSGAAIILRFEDNGEEVVATIGSMIDGVSALIGTFAVDFR